MWTSSVATPAASEQLALALGRGEEAEQRPQPLAAGGERLARDRRRRSPCRRPTACASRASSSAMYGGEARGRVDGRRRAFTPRLPVWSAMIEPASSRNSTSLEARALEQRRELLGRREPRDRGRQVRVGGAARQQPAEQRHDPVEPEREERPEDPARPRDLEDREPPAGPQHAAELAQRELEIGDVPDAEADRRRVEDPSSNGSASRSPSTQSSAGALRRARSSIRGEKSSPVTDAGAGAQVGEREVAGAAGGVEHAVAGPDDRRGREPPPAQVEPAGHHAVHRVVDRARSGRTSSGRTQARASRLSSPHALGQARSRGRPGRARARRRSRRGRRCSTASW